MERGIQPARSVQTAETSLVGLSGISGSWCVSEGKAGDGAQDNEKR